MGRGRPGPEPRFTREELARRALAIMDAHGTEAGRNESGDSEFWIRRHDEY